MSGWFFAPRVRPVIGTITSTESVMVRTNVKGGRPSPFQRRPLYMIADTDYILTEWS